jgi:hypothetical protein
MSYSGTGSSLRLTRLGAYLATLGASLGLVAGVAELTLGPHIRSWVGGKQDTTRLGLTTITLSATALLAAVSWMRRSDPSPGTGLLVAVGLIVPGAICFTTAGRAWYLPGALLLAAGATTVSHLRQDAREVGTTIGRSWLSALTFVLGAFYVLLGATALDVAGTLGIVGGVVILALVATSARIPLRVGQLVLVAAALPFALLTWWSVVTPLIGILVVALGWFALGQPRAIRSVSRQTQAAQATTRSKRLLRLGNLFVIVLLRSPAHRLLSSSLLLISFRGRRSGRRFTIPVMYAERGGMLTVFVTHPERKPWWRNMRKGAEVEVRLRGDRLRGQAAVASDAAVAGTYLERYPRARAAIRAAEPATFVRIRELEPSPGRLHREVSGNVR